MHDMIMIIVVLALFLLVMLTTKHFEKHLSAELARKIIHMFMGLCVLSFPFIFDNRFSVLVILALALGALTFLRVNKNWQNKIASSLFGVERKSYGELYFGLAVAIIFLRYQQLVEYIIPISILTFADSVAALVGVKYGQAKLSVSLEDSKSGEGSVMFFITAFLCTLIPLQLFTTVGRAEVLLISFLIGVLAAMIEAISLNGQDNFLLPMLTYSFLLYNMPKTTAELLPSFIYMLVFVAIAIFVYKFTTISKLSAAYAILIGYNIMILGGIFYLLPALFLFVGFGILPFRIEAEKELVLPSIVIKCNASVAVVCLLLQSFRQGYEQIFYLAYCLSFACHMMINTYNRFINFLTEDRKKALRISIYKSFALSILPIFIISYLKYNGTWQLMCYFLICFASFVPIALYLCHHYDYKCVSRQNTNLNQAAVGLITAIYLTGSFLWTILS